MPFESVRVAEESWDGRQQVGDAVPRPNQSVFTGPKSLRTAMAEFIEFSNYRRYHEGIGKVTPADFYFGRRQEILKQRRDQKQITLYSRF